MKKVLFFTISLMSAINLFAQNVGIGTSTPDASAKLDVVDANRGLLIPRVALTATNAPGPVTSPATSLLVYNTATAGTAPNNVWPGFYYWDGAKWVRLDTGNGDWKLDGNTNGALRYIGTNDNFDFPIYTNGTEKMRVTTAGNVGIGTTNPTAKLHVFNSNANAEVRQIIGFTNVGGPTTGRAVLSLDAPYGSDLHLIAQGGTASTFAGVPAPFAGIASVWRDLVFSVTNNGLGAERMRITTNGNVGIGTTAPGADVGMTGGLTINGTNGTQLTVQRNGTSGFAMNVGQNIAGDVNMYDKVGGTWNHAITLRGGNVGIGTTTPTAKLHVFNSDANAEVRQIIELPNVGGPSTGRAVLSLKANDANGSDLHLIAQGGLFAPSFLGVPGNCSGIASTRRDLVFSVVWSGGGWERMRITTQGDVGIGTTTPNYRLHVAGNVGSTGFYTTSDQRWKTNIKPIPNALDNVLKMQGVTYYLKVDEYPDKQFPDTKQIGFIAQELEKVYPEVVFTDKDGYKSVDYSKLTPILVEAIKDQQKIIQDQQKIIQQLQKENNQMKAEMKLLNEKVDNLINSLPNHKKLVTTE